MTNIDKINAAALALFEQALDHPPKKRAQWISEQADNQTIRKKALKYLKRDESGSSAFHTGGAFHDTLDDTAIPEQIGAYRITGLIGRGGMGAVYRGERASDDFEHDVAIKVVRPGAMSDKLVARFQTERQTLARLIHPNIARLYDGGTLENGAPYIVMEYIDGLPITDWADKENLSQAQRLKLFQAACSAVGYAHQNLIIHRDITPSNVLVDKDGNVKLIDFGIAKPFDEDAAVTDPANSLASMSFTPGFAAPERSKGAGASTLSDIYSLGKLLGQLLSVEIPSPDLSAIITKATQENPTLRYPSIDSLSDDIRDFKTGYPVSARKISKMEWAQKFAKRHRQGVSLAGLGLLVLLGAFGATLYQYIRAETALISANQRFNETRELTSFLLDDLPKDLASLPGTLPIAEKVNSTSARYLDILADAAKSDKSVLYDYAVGHSQLAEVFTQAGGANLGDPEQGLKHFETSLKVLKGMAHQAPDDVDVLTALANAEIGYGYSLIYDLGEEAKGLPYLNDAVEHYKRALTLKPDDPKIKIYKARAEMMQTYMQHQEDRDPYPAFQRLRAEFETLLEQYPDHKDTLPHYASFLRIIANYDFDYWDSRDFMPIPLKDKPHYINAMESLERSLEIIEQLLTDEPTHPAHIYQYVWSMEIYALLATMDAEWNPLFEDLVEEFSQVAQTEGSEGIDRIAKTHERFKERREISEMINRGMDKSDVYLTRIAPFDEQSFSHKEAVYFNLKARAYMEAQLQLDFKSSQSYLQQSLDMAREQALAEPALKNAAMEVGMSLNEMSYLLMAKQALYETSQQDEICSRLKEAKSVWQNYASKHGTAGDFDASFDGNATYTDQLLDTNSCAD